MHAVEDDLFIIIVLRKSASKGEVRKIPKSKDCVSVNVFSMNRMGIKGVEEIWLLKMYQTSTGVQKEAEQSL